MIDNYDSFTYNLVQCLRELGAEVEVLRNDAMAGSRLSSLNPDGVVVSPGPGTPDDAGVSMEAVRVFADERIPLLGVCLGHQAIAQAFGAGIRNAGRVMHGKVSSISHDGCGLFESLPEPFPATRYHSLSVVTDGLPECLEVSARSEDGEIMGLRHVTLPIDGVQFHPESVCTPDGASLLRNFVSACQERAATLAPDGSHEWAPHALSGPSGAGWS